MSKVGISTSGLKALIVQDNMWEELTKVVADSFTTTITSGCSDSEHELGWKRIKAAAQ